MNITKMIAGEKVQAGDLLAVGDDGRVRFIEEGSLTRPLVQGRPINVANQTQETYFLGTNPVKGTAQKAIASLTLPNGNYAVGYTANESYHVSVFKPTGELAYKQTFGRAEVDAEIALTATSDNTLFVAIKNGSTGEVQYVLIDAEGAINNGTFLVNSDRASSLSITAMANDSVVVAYAVDNDIHCVYATVLTKQGEIAIPTHIVDSFDEATIYSQTVKTVALSEGGFAIVYGGVSKGVGKVFFKLSNQVGLIDSSTRTQAGEDLTTCTGGPFVAATALKNGGFAVGSYGGLGPGFQLAIFDQAGENYGGTLLLESFDGNNFPNRMDLTCLKNGNVAVVWASLFAYASVYTPAGRVVFSRANYGNSVGSIAVAPAGEGAAVAFQGVNPADSTLQLYAGQVGPLMYGEVGMTTIESAGRYSGLVVGGMDNILPFEDATMMYAGGNVDGDMLQVDILGTYTQRAQSVIGVAVADAEENQAVEVIVDGAAILRTPFKLPVTVNARDENIPGQRAAIIGNTAFLKGIQ